MPTFIVFLTSLCVSDAVRPKFEVVIKAPRIVHQQDVLHGSVCAK